MNAENSTGFNTLKKSSIRRFVCVLDPHRINTSWASCATLRVFRQSPVVICEMTNSAPDHLVIARLVIRPMLAARPCPAQVCDTTARCLNHLWRENQIIATEWTATASISLATSYGIRLDPAISGSLESRAYSTAVPRPHRFWLRKVQCDLCFSCVS